jgi:putative NIF3 family GTP cyclohydrolase 1 type 2
MQLTTIRHTSYLSKPISRVAICGGSGSFLLQDAIRQKADIFISADFKYHEFFEANDQIVIADIGHYESEVFTKDLLCDYLREKFANIAVRLSDVNTNPIIYL